jgi:hypothetical protein
MATTEATLEDPNSNSPTTTTKARSSQRSLVLALVTLAQFMIIVDSTIVQVALPSVGREFGVSVNGLQWIVTAYGLTLAGFLMLSGRVGDRLVSGSCVCRNDIYSDELSSAGARLLCAFSRPCICPNGCCISSHFWIFVSSISKSLRCQTNFDFGDDFADNQLPIPFAHFSHRKLLWRIARTNARHWV